MPFTAREPSRKATLLRSSQLRASSLQLLVDLLVAAGRAAPPRLA
jgi:hypothetical protein